MANVLQVASGWGCLNLTSSLESYTHLRHPRPKAILVREQVLQVLQLLVERGGKIVTREEIKTKLWGNETVVDFDHSLLRQLRVAW